MNRLASIHLGGGIQHLKSKPTTHGTDLGDQEDFRSKLGGKNAVNWGDKIRLNGTPTDTTGHVMQGADDANFEATYDRAWDNIEKFNGGYVFTKWRWDGVEGAGPIDFGSVVDNFGCTPTVKAHKADEDSNDHELVVWQVYAEKTPYEINSNELVFKIS